MKSLADILKRTKKQEPPRRQGRFTSSRSRNLPNSSSKQGGSLSGSLFKRGRTMPGTTRQGLIDAEKHAIRAATPREKIRHLAYIRRLVLTVLSISAIASLVLFIAVQQFSASVSIGSLSQHELKSPAYKDSIQNYLRAHPLERFRFNLSERNLTEYVQTRHPEVASITQDGNYGFATTHFILNLRRPVASWDVGGVRYYVDADGVSFEKNSYKDPSVRIVDNSGVRYTPGTAIASERFLSFVGRVVALSNQQSHTVKEVIIPTGTTRQAEVRLEGVSYSVLMSIERGPAEQVEDMTRSINYLTSQNRQPKYIDVRVKGKAFYRE